MAMSFEGLQECASELSKDDVEEEDPPEDGEDVSESTASHTFIPKVLTTNDVLLEAVSQAQRLVGHRSSVKEVRDGHISEYHFTTPAVPIPLLLNDLFGANSDFLGAYHKERGDFNTNFPKWRCPEPWCGERTATWNSIVYAPTKQTVDVIEHQSAALLQQGDLCHGFVFLSSCTPKVAMGDSFRVESVLHFKGPVKPTVAARMEVSVAGHSAVVFVKSCWGLGSTIKAVASREIASSDKLLHAQLVSRLQVVRQVWEFRRNQRVERHRERKRARRSQARHKHSPSVANSETGNRSFATAQEAPTKTPTKAALAKSSPSAASALDGLPGRDVPLKASVANAHERALTALEMAAEFSPFSTLVEDSLAHLTVFVPGADIEAVLAAFANPDSPMMPEYHQARGDSRLSLGDWQCVGPEGQAVPYAQAWAGQRQVTWESTIYAPTKRVVQVLERQLFVFCRTPEGTKLVVQHSSCTPGAPYGTSFRVELGFVAGNEPLNGKAGVALAYDSHVHFLQRTVMQRLIRSTAGKELNKFNALLMEKAEAATKEYAKASKARPSSDRSPKVRSSRENVGRESSVGSRRRSNSPESTLQTCLSFEESSVAEEEQVALHPVKRTPPAPPQSRSPKHGKGKGVSVSFSKVVAVSPGSSAHAWRGCATLPAAHRRACTEWAMGASFTDLGALLRRPDTSTGLRLSGTTLNTTFQALCGRDARRGKDLLTAFHERIGARGLDFGPWQEAVDGWTGTRTGTWQMDMERSSGQRVEVRPEERQLFFFCELPQGEQHAVVHLSCVMMDASTKTMLRIETLIDARIDYLSAVTDDIRVLISSSVRFLGFVWPWRRARVRARVVPYVEKCNGILMALLQQRLLDWEAVERSQLADTGSAAAPSPPSAARRGSATVSASIGVDPVAAAGDPPRTPVLPPPRPPKSGGLGVGEELIEAVPEGELWRRLALSLDAASTLPALRRVEQCVLNRVQHYIPIDRLMLLGLLHCLEQPPDPPEVALLSLKILRHVCTLQQNVLLLVACGNALPIVETAVQRLQHLSARTGLGLPDRQLVQELQLCGMQVEELQRFHHAFVPEVDRRFQRTFRHADHVINSFPCRLHRRFVGRSGTLYVTYQRLAFYARFRRVTVSWARVEQIDAVPGGCLGHGTMHLRLRLVMGRCVEFGGFPDPDGALLCLKYVQQEVMRSGADVLLGDSHSDSSILTDTQLVVQADT